MKIKFLGQSGYLLKSGNTEIIIDPYLSDSVNRVAGRPRHGFGNTARAVFYNHK